MDYEQKGAGMDTVEKEWAGGSFESSSSASSLLLHSPTYIQAASVYKEEIQKRHRLHL